MDTIKSPRFWLAALIVVAVTLLRALDKIGGDAAMGALGGLGAGFGIGIGGGGGGAVAALKKTGGAAAILAALLGSVLLFGGCGVDWSKVISEAGVVVHAAAQAGRGVQATIGVSCKLVQRYGSDGDYQRCLAVEQAAKQASGVAEAADGALTATAPQTSVSVADLGAVQVTAVAPMATVMQLQQRCPMRSGPPPRPIGFTRPGAETDSKPVEVR